MGGIPIGGGGNPTYDGTESAVRGTPEMLLLPSQRFEVQPIRFLTSTDQSHRPRPQAASSNRHEQSESGFGLRKRMLFPPPSLVQRRSASKPHPADWSAIERA